MKLRNFLSGYLISFLCLFFSGCNFADIGDLVTNQNSIKSTQTQEFKTINFNTEIINTEIPDPTEEFTTSPVTTCKLGLGLREETIDFLLKHKDQTGMIMAASSNLAETYFPLFDNSLRVLGAPSLNTLETKASRAQDANLPYDVLGYGLETSASTPEIEWEDVTGATQKAKEISDKYDKYLLMAPGFKLMSQNINFYAKMAEKADIWILQTQQLQKSPPGPEYRQEVERIVSLIRSGNPEIIIWAQITLPPDRTPDAEEWLVYRESIIDLVDGIYIGVYTWDKISEIELLNEIEAIYDSVCDNNEVE